MMKNSGSESFIYRTREKGRTEARKRGRAEKKIE